MIYINKIIILSMSLISLNICYVCYNHKNNNNNNLSVSSHPGLLRLSLDQLFQYYWKADGHWIPTNSK